MAATSNIKTGFEERPERGILKEIENKTIPDSP